MWEQDFVELFTTIIPQSFAIMLLFFSFVRIRVRFGSWALFSLVISVVLFFVKPYVNFGVHSTITMFMLVVIAVLWGKANLLASVIFSVLTFVVAFLCEMLAFLYFGALNLDMKLFETDTQIRAIAGILPLVLLFAVSLIVFFAMKNKVKEVIPDAADGKVVE